MLIYSFLIDPHLLQQKNVDDVITSCCPRTKINGNLYLCMRGGDGEVTVIHQEYLFSLDLSCIDS